MNLNQYLTKHNISVAQAASKLGKSRAYINELVNGNLTAGKKLALDIMEWTNGDVHFAEVMFTPEEIDRIHKI